jgi:hypothetical protein
VAQELAHVLQPATLMLAGANRAQDRAGLGIEQMIETIAQVI